MKYLIVIALAFLFSQTAFGQSGNSATIYRGPLTSEVFVTATNKGFNVKIPGDRLAGGVTKFYVDSALASVEAGSIRAAVQTFTGSGNSYTVTNTPILNTPIVTVNGKEEGYSQSGRTLTLNPSYTIDAGDQVRIKYNY